MKFFESLRRRSLNRRVNREIFDSIFPHLNERADFGYPFKTNEEFEKAALFAELDVKLHIALIEKRADRMPEAYGRAFRYVAYRELDKLAKAFLEVGKERVQDPTVEDSPRAARCVAGPA